MPQATPARCKDSAPSFSFPAVGRKKVTAAFDGGRLTSDGRVLLLAQAEREMEICGRLAACIADRRDPSRVVHKLDDILRARIFAIACGYEDSDDLDALRDDPGIRLALGQAAGIGCRPRQSADDEPLALQVPRLGRRSMHLYLGKEPRLPGGAPTAQLRSPRRSCAWLSALLGCPIR